MLSFGGVQIHGPKGKDFDVIKAFTELDSARKLALFDHMNESPKSFYRTVTLFWPEAKKTDSKRLERFILSQMAANDK